MYHLYELLFSSLLGLLFSAVYRKKTSLIFLHYLMSEGCIAATWRLFTQYSEKGILIICSLFLAYLDHLRP